MSAHASSDLRADRASGRAADAVPDPGPVRASDVDARTRRVAAFDPGGNVGLAVVDGAGRLQRRAIVRVDELDALTLPEGAEVVVGSGTGRHAVRRALLARGLRVALVDERDTTLLARELWREANPPRGLGRLVPPGLRAPPGPIDDYAAWAIALRYLGRTRPG